MDINSVNTMIDQFMKGLYDVDVYLTPLSYKGDDTEYQINILFFPSKFLKGSPDFSEKYYNFLNRDYHDILEDILKSFKYLGLGNVIKSIDDHMKTIIAEENSDYLKNYTNNLLDNMKLFLKTETADDINVSHLVSDVKVDRTEFLIRTSDSGSDIQLRLNPIASGRVDLTPWLNTDNFRKPLFEYLKKKMKLDPQIDFWFE